MVRGPPLWWAAVAARNGEEGDDGGVRLAQLLLAAGADPRRRGSYGVGSHSAVTRGGHQNKP